MRCRSRSVTTALASRPGARANLDPFFVPDAPGVDTGFDLPATRKLIDRLGGRISASSNPGGGTRFLSTLPTAAREGAHPERARRGYRRPRGSRVLLLDDDPLILRSLKRGLSGHFDCLTLDHPQAALQALDRERFDVVVADVVMPDPQRVRAVRRARGTPPGAHPPLTVSLRRHLLAHARDSPARNRLPHPPQPDRPGGAGESGTAVSARRPLREPRSGCRSATRSILAIAESGTRCWYPGASKEVPIARSRRLRFPLALLLIASSICFAEAPANNDAPSKTAGKPVVTPSGLKYFELKGHRRGGRSGQDGLGPLHRLAHHRQEVRQLGQSWHAVSTPHWAADRSSKGGTRAWPA